jgi:surface protein
MSGMFRRVQVFKNFSFDKLDTSKVTNMSYMFWNSSAETYDLTNLKTNALTNTKEMFYQNKKLTTIYAPESLSFANVTESTGMFGNCPAIVGGNGTVWTGQKTDKTYARVDKKGQAGYFTKPPRYVGDMNDDGRITADDAIIAARTAAGYSDYAKRYAVKYGDMNQDGKITADDAIIIARVAAGYGSYAEKYKILVK